MPILVGLASLALAATPAVDDGAIIAQVINDICRPFVHSRDFGQAVAAAKARGFSGEVSGTTAELEPAGTAHALQISLKKDEFSELVECKLLMHRTSGEAAIAAVRTTLGGSEPEIVPNSPDSPPTHVWSDETGAVRVFVPGGTARLVLAVSLH